MCVLDSSVENVVEDIFGHKINFVIIIVIVIVVVIAYVKSKRLLATKYLLIVLAIIPLYVMTIQVCLY